MHIDFNYNVSGEILPGRLSQPNGVPSGWHLTIGNYYWGQLIYQNGSWRFYGNQRAEISGDDLQILIDMVDAAKN